MAAIGPLPVDLTGRLENPGDSCSEEGRIEVAELEVGERDLGLPEGIAYRVVLTNAGEGILVTGIARAAACAPCDRCLEPASFDIAGEIEEYYLFREPDDPDAYEDGFEVLGEDRVIDLSGPVLDAVVMDVPFVVLCRPDCRGLCPVCGANLNRETCDCAERAAAADAASDANPFAALKGLKLDG